MSLQNDVIAYLRNFPEGVKLASIRDAIKRPAAQITTTLWKMKKAGIVAHDKATHEYKLLTHVNKTQDAVIKEDTAKTIGKLLVEITEYKKTLDRADATYDALASKHRVLETAHTQLKEKYDDALAIVRYLENKLYLVIKSNRANGNA
jgi:hypothetical protein